MSGGDPIAARERLICGPMEAYSRDRGSLFRSIVERVKTLIALADRLVRAGDEHRANALLDEAQVVARTTDDDWKRGHALTAIASALVRVERYDEALQFGHAVQGELSWSWALVDLTKALLQAGRYDKAKEGAHAIEGGVKRVKALGAVAYSLAQAGHYDEALETTDEVLEAINAIEDGRERMEADRASDRERALKTVAIGLAQAGRYDDALEVARALRVYQEQADALTDLAHALNAPNKTAARVGAEAV